jgi:rhodanese-related sulfurtransferase
MRLIARPLLAAALTFTAVSHAADTPKIDQASLLKRIEKKDASMLILDVRTPEEFAVGHVPGAINIPYAHMPARISEVADAGDKDIVLYCATGIRAEKGAERLRENGFTKLLHLDGDMQAWEAQKRPLEK